MTNTQENTSAQPDNDTFMDKVQKWIPDRKVLSAGIAGVVAFFITTGFPDVPADAVTAIVGGVMGLVAYFVPPSKQDLIRKADDTLKALGEKHNAEIKVIAEPKKDLPKV